MLAGACGVARTFFKRVRVDSSCLLFSNAFAGASQIAQGFGKVAFEGL
jgi:hypothetical protein